MNIWLTILCGFLILAGTAGAGLPFLPGLPVALVGLWIFAIANHFQVVSLWAAIVFTIFAIVVEVANVMAPGIGAKGAKSTRWGVVGAFIGTVIGVALFGPLGIVIGPFVGTLLGEMMRGTETEHAVRSARGAVVGILIGSFLKISFGLSMFIYFVVVAIRFGHLR